MGGDVTVGWKTASIFADAVELTSVAGIINDQVVKVKRLALAVEIVDW